MQLPCPTCKEPSFKEKNDSWPFCSERCRMVDLGKWVNEEYRIPVRDSLPDAESLSTLSDDEDEDQNTSL